MTRAIELALFVAALLISGLVTCALLWSGDAPYRDLARENRIDRYVFVLQPPLATHEMDLEGAVAVHASWSRYVTGGTDEQPTWEPALFSEDEYRHMADVRRVFDVAKFLVPASLFVMVVRLQRARVRGSRDMWALVRNGAIVSAALVALVGAVAAVAFEPMFLLFHYVFFPQGNFLFDPATSNLVRLYPDWYWEGISVRVGLSFAAIAAALVVVAALRLRAVK